MARVFISLLFASSTTRFYSQLGQQIKCNWQSWRRAKGPRQEGGEEQQQQQLKKKGRGSDTCVQQMRIIWHGIKCFIKTASSMQQQCSGSNRTYRSHLSGKQAAFSTSPKGRATLSLGWINTKGETKRGKRCENSTNNLIEVVISKCTRRIRNVAVLRTAYT